MNLKQIILEGFKKADLERRNRVNEKGLPERFCETCGKWKPVDNFSNVKPKYTCKECVKNGISNNVDEFIKKYKDFDSGIKINDIDDITPEILNVITGPITSFNITKKYIYNDPVKYEIYRKFVHFFKNFPKSDIMLLYKQLNDINNSIDEPMIARYYKLRKWAENLPHSICRRMSIDNINPELSKVIRMAKSRKMSIRQQGSESYIKRTSKPENKEKRRLQKLEDRLSGKTKVLRANVRNVKKQNVIELKKQSEGCIKCSEKRYWVLDFHHRDPSLKVESVARLIDEGRKWNTVIWPEIKKCDVVCANCHRGFHKSKYYDYKPNELYNVPVKLKNRDDKILGEYKPGLVDYIKYKWKIKCQNCGISGKPWALDFHHRDPSQKDLAVTKLAGTFKDFFTIKNEIDKCDVLCANCHRDKHHKEKNTNSDLGEVFGDSEEKFI